MQNISSLLSLPADGNAVNSIPGANNSPGEDFEGLSPGQSDSFLKTLDHFLAGDAKPIQSVLEASGALLANSELQELPESGNVLPKTEIFIEDIKAFLKDFSHDLTNFNNENLSPDQKIITQHLAEQISEIERLIQEPNGEDIRIPAWFANDVLKNIKALENSGAFTIQDQGAARQTFVISGIEKNIRPDQGAQPVIDVDKTSIVSSETKLSQLSNFIQNITATLQEHNKAKPEAGISGLLQSSQSLFEVKNGDTMIANITALSNQVNSSIGEKSVPSIPVNAAFNQSGWGDEIGERVRWLVSQNIQTAELRLNPPQLGPIEVKVTVQNDQMNVMFTAHHATVREALESAVPKLREMFGDSGLNLVDVDISQHSFSDRHRATSDHEQNYRYINSNEENDEITSSIDHEYIQKGLVDYYA